MEDDFKLKIRDFLFSVRIQMQNGHSNHFTSEPIEVRSSEEKERFVNALENMGCIEAVRNQDGSLYPGGRNRIEFYANVDIIEECIKNATYAPCGHMADLGRKV